MQKLKTFDVSTVSEAALKKVRNKYLSQENFNFAYIFNKSQPAGNLCKWI